MIFLGVVPVAFAAFGNFVVPLQIGAPDMTFPKINMASYWSFLVGGLIMLASFFVPGGAAKSGWYAYTPLSVIADKGPNYDAFWNGQNLWLIAFIFLITSSLLGAVNFITTIIQLRTKGLTWMRLPFFVWAQFITAFLLLLAFPPLEAAAVMQLMDRLAGTSLDRKSTRLNSSHANISYAVFCLKKKNIISIHPFCLHFSHIAKQP